MVQSVELLLDDEAERAVLAEWDLLGDAGLPTSRRPDPPPSHRPHITLLAADAIDEGAEVALSRLVDGLDLTVRIGAPLVFTKRRRDQVVLILVRQVVTSVALLRLQQQVVAAAGPGLGAEFAPGRWTPHVTLARRMNPDQVGAALGLLARQRHSAERDARITRARRWDGEAKRDWLL